MFRTTLLAATAALALATPTLADVLTIHQGYVADGVLDPDLTVDFSSGDESDATLFLDDEDTRERLGNPLLSINTPLVGEMTYRGLSVVGSLRNGTISDMTGLIPWAEAEIYVQGASGVTFADVVAGDTPLEFDPEAADEEGYYDAQMGCHSFFFGLHVPPPDLFPGGGGGGLPPIPPQPRELIHDRFVASLESGSLGVCLQQLSAAHSSVDPVMGNPDSLQGAMLRSGLELGGGENPFLPEPELLSFGFTRFDAGAFDGERYDVRLQKAWPVLGGGTQLLLDLPVSLIDTGDDTALAGHVGVGLRFPVVEGRWTLTPRVAFGVTSSDEVGGDGELWSGSLASRYLLSNIAGGKLVIGNMIAYTATTETGLSGSDLNPDLENWVFRNGVAYQLPSEKWRLGYVFTHLSGDDLFLENLHEVSVDYDGFEAVRVGLKATAGDDYEAVTLSAGLRF